MLTQAPPGPRSPASVPAVNRALVTGRELEPADQIRDAELILTAFRTLVLAVVFAAPRFLGLNTTYTRDEILLAALAGVYNIAMGVACLFPGRYGVRRPLILAMDTMLITVWIHYTGWWQLISFYYIVVVASAMWYRVAGGVVAAAICDFLVLFLWGHVAAEATKAGPPPFIATMTINTSLLFMVGGLTGYMAETQDREREIRLERELLIANYEAEIDVAAQLQPLLIGLLEQSHGRLELGSAFQTARTMAGGDYLDALRLPGGQTLLCIADVAGKSVRAQARVPLLKYSLRALAPLHPRPDELVERLQSTLENDLHSELYIALCLVVLDPEAHEISWCNAGHIPPLLVRPLGRGQELDDQGPEIRLLQTTTPALGLFPEVKPRAERMPWFPGDTLLLFTDGLADALSFGGSEDGELQVQKVAARLAMPSGTSAMTSAEAFVALASAALGDGTEGTSLLRSWDSGANRTVHRDDVAVMVARFLGDGVETASKIENGR